MLKKASANICFINDADPVPQGKHYGTGIGFVIKNGAEAIRMGFNVYVREIPCKEGNLKQDPGDFFTDKHKMKDIKRAIYNEHEGICPICGQHYEFDQMEAHHVLPWFKYPELREAKENIEVLCVKCHKELHNNPWRLIEQMKAKAAELGINLEERYGKIE